MKSQLFWRPTQAAFLWTQLKNSTEKTPQLLLIIFLTNCEREIELQHRRWPVKCHMGFGKKKKSFPEQSRQCLLYIPTTGRMAFHSISRQISHLTHPKCYQLKHPGNAVLCCLFMPKHNWACIHLVWEIARFTCGKAPSLKTNSQNIRQCHLFIGFMHDLASALPVDLLSGLWLCTASVCLSFVLTLSTSDFPNPVDEF